MAVFNIPGYGVAEVQILCKDLSIIKKIGMKFIENRLRIAIPSLTPPPRNLVHWHKHKNEAKGVYIITGRSCKETVAPGDAEFCVLITRLNDKTPSFKLLLQYAEGNYQQN